MPDKLTGKTALVTGATRGIGRAITELFLENGAHVAGIYHTADEQAQDLAQASPGRFHPVKFDLRHARGIPAMISALPEEYHDIDILVNNAGIKCRSSFFDSSPEAWDESMDINLRAPYVLMQAIAKGMVARQQGRIINITSQASPNLSTDSIEYGMSKSGLVHATKAIAKLLAPDNITVNAISPGRTYTDFTGYDTNPSKEQAALARIPLRHINQPEEIGEMALFLACETGSNITGQVIALDGGEVIH